MKYVQDLGLLHAIETDIASEGSYVKEGEVTLVKTNGWKHETVYISNQR